MSLLVQLPYPVQLVDAPSVTPEAREQLYSWKLYLQRAEGLEVPQSEVLSRILLTYRAPSTPPTNNC